MPDHKTHIDMVREFHERFGVPAPDRMCLPRDRAALRLRLMREEMHEVSGALARGDKAEALHELTDLYYILLGTLIEFGMADYLHASMCEVHRANMSKLGADGRPVLRADGKVCKGPHFQPANVRLLVDLSKALIPGE